MCLFVNGLRVRALRSDDPHLLRDDPHLLQYLKAARNALIVCLFVKGRGVEKRRLMPLNENIYACQQVVKHVSR